MRRYVLLGVVAAGALTGSAVALATDTGVTSALSSATKVTVGVNPTNTARPTITGTAQDGDTLTGSLGTWTNTQWFAWWWEDCSSTGSNCVPIAGATGTTTDPTVQPVYVLATSDVGHRIRLKVTAYDYPQSTTAVSP